MKVHRILGVVLSLALMPTNSNAAVYTHSAAATQASNLLVTAQYGAGWGRGWGGGWHRGWRGRPYWYARPWVRRPYYGTIIAGVALGTLITVAAVGAVPRRPAPNLCWYWADPYRSRGYWDYCS
jgi:hypothetical protein